jgi:hypothetical protein
LKNIRDATGWLVDQLQYIVFWTAIIPSLIVSFIVLANDRNSIYPLSDVIGFALGIATLVSSVILLLASGTQKEEYLGKLAEHRVFVGLGFFTAMITSVGAVLNTISTLLK